MKFRAYTVGFFLMSAILWAQGFGEKNPLALDFFSDGLLDELLTGDYKSALANFVIAETYDPQDPFLKEEIARTYLELGNPAQAYLKAREALFAGDSTMDLYLILAQATAQMGKCEEAAKYFNRTAPFGLDYADIFLVCAQVCENPDPAIKGLKKIARRFPKNAKVKGVLGELYRQKGEFKKARKFLSEAIKLDPEFPQAYISLVNTFLSTRQFDSAMVYLKKYVYLFPQDDEIKEQYIEKVAIYSGVDEAIGEATKFYAGDSLRFKMVLEKLGYDFLGINDYFSALKVFKKLIEVYPDDPVEYYFAGKCYDELWCPDSALIMYNRAIEISPDCDAYTDKALIWARFGEVESLFADFNASVDLCSDSASYWQWMGVAFRAAKIYPVATSCFEEAIRNCGGTDVAFSLADTRERAGFRSEAIFIIDSLLHCEAPGSPTLLNYLGYILADDSVHLDYAESLLTLALQKEPNNPAYLDSYGWLLFRRGDIKGALKYIEKAAKLYGDDTEIQLHLGDIYLKLGDLKRARYHWWRAVQLDPDNEIARNRLEKYRDER